VDEFCNSCLAFIKTQALKKSITVTYMNEAAVPRLFADPRRLKQIVINLLTNAVKFTLVGGHVTLQVQYTAEQDLIQFSVIDDGIGIAREHLQRLFQPFVQLDSRLNRQYEGTGLGLALVHKLTDLHGGSVSVESEPGKGSRFTINLPCRQERIKELELLQPAPLFPEAQEKAEAPVEPSMLHGVILLAEDKAANVMTIGDYLENYGFEVVVAHDGLEAIEKAEAIKPDLILMDIQMPVLDGLEAMARLRKDPSFQSTPIIALTVLAMPGDRERCLLAGASEYMSKPVSLKRLKQTIENLLQG
jgi:CheY-like chemotaxis protein/anti-sigma regulatory factor (Ser/Thr protein kinase)